MDWFLRREGEPKEFLNAIYYAGSKLVAAESNGIDAAILTSADGQMWDYRELSGRVPQGIAYGAGIWVVVGTSAILTSADAKTWTARVQPRNVLQSVTYGLGVFVAVGSDGLILRSTDARTWVEQTNGNDNLVDVSFLNDQFVAVSQGGLVYTSPDGSAWTSHTTPTWPELGLAGVTYGSGRYVSVGYNGRNRYLEWNQISLGFATETIRSSLWGEAPW